MIQWPLTERFYSCMLYTKTLTIFQHFTISPSTISPSIILPLRVIPLCNFVVFRLLQGHAIIQEFGSLRYMMKYFSSWILYVWRHVQYCNIRTVTIVTQITFIVSLLIFGLWEYSFYVPQGYYSSIFSYNVVFVSRVVC